MAFMLLFWPLGIIFPSDRSPRFRSFRLVPFLLVLAIGVSGSSSSVSISARCASLFVPTGSGESGVSMVVRAVVFVALLRVFGDAAVLLILDTGNGCVNPC